MNFYDFNPQSQRPLLHLAHANGFPPATYARCLEPLLEKFHAISFYARPFWPDPQEFQTLKDWSVLRDDLLQGLREFQGQKMVAVGHSLGGVTTLNVAIQQPELFSHVILIDPTMLAPAFLRQIAWRRFWGMEFRKDLVEGALRRRRQWESWDQAYRSFKEKPLFKKWPDDILRSYVEGMTAPDGKGGVRLIYSPEGEARIYRTIPTDVWKKVKSLRLPTLVIRGEHSNIFTEESEKCFRKAYPRAWFKVVQGSGHLVPQEQPERVGQLMAEFLT